MQEYNGLMQGHIKLKLKPIQILSLLSRVEWTTSIKITINPI